MDGEPDVADPRLLAGVHMLERTGARGVRIGFTDEEAEGEPVVWHATATWHVNAQGLPIARGGRLQHEAAGALHPVTAVMRLCELVVDGRRCAHCTRPTIFTPDVVPGILDEMGCVYSYDPELQTFRRGCEGDEA